MTRLIMSPNNSSRVLVAEESRRIVYAIPRAEQDRVNPSEESQGNRKIIAQINTFCLEGKTTSKEFKAICKELA